MGDGWGVNFPIVCQGYEQFSVEELQQLHPLNLPPKNAVGNAWETGVCMRKKFGSALIHYLEI